MYYYYPLCIIISLYQPSQQNTRAILCNFGAHYATLVSSHRTQLSNRFFFGRNDNSISFQIIHIRGIKHHYMVPSFCSGGGFGTARGIIAGNSGVLSHWRRIVFLLLSFAFWYLGFFLCLLVFWCECDGLKHAPNISRSAWTQIQDWRRWRQRQGQPIVIIFSFIFFCLFFLLYSTLIHFPLKSLWYKMAIFQLDLFNIAVIKFLKFSSCWKTLAPAYFLIFSL